MAKVSFLGLGVMGYPMAGHLLKKGGHDVTVYNRSPAKAAQWVKEYGGKSAATPKEAAQGCDFVMMCVGNDDDVRSVAYGDSGVLAGMKKGAIFVDHTTASASVARELHKKAKEKGIGFVDAPVSGGQAGAVNGQLGIMCGGEQADFDRAKPVLDAYAKMCALIGAPGRRAAHQDGEPDLHRRHGAGRWPRASPSRRRTTWTSRKSIAVISKGAAQSWQMDNRWKPMSELKAEGFGFAIEWMRKDVGICLAQAKQSGARLPVTALVDQFYAHLEARGGKRWDSTSALIQLLLKD